MENYRVYSLKMHGWWGMGTWTSVYADAKHFTRDAAVKFCRTRFNPGEGLGAIPVNADDVTEVQQK